MLPICIQNLVKELNVNGWFSDWSFLENAKIKMVFWNKNNSPTTKIKAEITINQTFLGDVDAKRITELIAAEQIKTLSVSTSPKPKPLELLPIDLLATSDPEQVDEYKVGINKRIDEGVALMNLNRFDDARTIFTTILGEIKGRSGMQKELGRIYNNTGVTYNRPSPEGNYDKAISFFHLAINSDDSMWKAKMNLAHALLNKGGEDSVSKGSDQARVLWVIEKNPDTLVTLLLAIRKSESADAVFKFLEDNAADTRGLIQHQDNLQCFLASTYLEKNNHTEALIHVDRALENSPNEPEYLYVKGRALIVRAQNEHRIESEFDIVPRLNDYRDAQDALLFFERAEVIAKEQRKEYLLPEVRYGMVMCQIWLNRFTESLQNLRLIQLENHSDLANHQIDVLHLDINIKNRDFDEALKTLKQGVGFSKIDYSEKCRIARVFIINGGLEQAKSLLSEIKSEAEQHQDVYYWFDLGVVCVLLNQKNEAITAAARAKKIAEDQSDIELKKRALSNYNAVMYHYSKSDDGEDSETGRLLDGVWDFQKQFPDEKIIHPIQAINEAGELTDEIKEVFNSTTNRVKRVREVYKESPLTIYHLEKVFGRGLADLVTNGGPDFPLLFTDANIAFKKEIDRNFANAKSFVLDYLSLLDLAKMGFLGYLEQLAQPILVHELLFKKIQEELLSKEIYELRILWDFLRKSKVVKICRDSSSHAFANPDTKKLFDEWITETLGIAVEKDSVFVTNDIRLLSFARTENIRSTNVLSFLDSWKERGIIDERMRSRAIGDLAERFYTFVSFTGEDLFEIAMEDRAKITARSYHLVREIFLPGSEAISFIGPFVRFTSLLWKTGALPQEKVQWLKFISATLTEVIDQEFIVLRPDPIKDQVVVGEVIERLKPITNGLAMIWEIATKTGNTDDLREVMTIINEALNKDYLKKIKEKIIEQIAERLK